MLNISNMKKWNSQKVGEQGMAAIFVVMTLMTLLALISIGFSRLMNREVRQSLDRQLSTAAYYAAESGVNDARAYLKDGGAKIDGCKTPNTSTGRDNFVNGGDISGDGLFKYSCVIVDPTPSELQFTIPAGQSKVVKLSGPDLSKLSSLYFGWQNAAPGTPQPLDSYGNLPQQGAVGENNTGLLRVGVYPLVDGCNDGTTYNRYLSALGGSGGNKTDAAIECASRNYFMYPSAGSGAAPDCGYANISASNGCVRYGNTGDNGGFVPGNCIEPAKKPNTSFSNQATPAYCNTLISDLLPVKTPATSNNAASYYLRLTAVYKELKVFIQASDNAAPIPKALTIANAEAVVDVTGTGNDVLRRIQARVPLQDSTPPLDYGLQSMESICKLFRNPVSNPGFLDQANPYSGPFNSDNACFAPSGSNNINSFGLPPINLVPPPTAHIRADSTNFNNGGSTNLYWSSTDAYSCTGTGFSTGPDDNPSGGPVSTGSLSSGTYTYSVSCVGVSGVAPDSVTITVNNPPPPDCNDHGGFVRGSWAGWHAEITGNNPCGVGFAQCVVVNAFTTETHSYGNANPVNDSSGMVGSVGCQDIQGTWYW
jgi:hypothetical protein